MSDLTEVRSQIDALAEAIAEAKKQPDGTKSEAYKQLVHDMMLLRKKLQSNGDSVQDRTSKVGNGSKGKNKKEKVPETSYFESRLTMVKSLGLMGAAYPHKMHIQYTIPELKAKYLPQLHEAGERIGELVTIAGRIVSKRSSSSNLHFITIQGDMELVQIISSVKDHSDAAAFSTIHGQIKRGDIIGVIGYPSLSKSGEFSVCSTEIRLLSTCFHMLPDDYFGLSDIEQRFRQRYLDLIVNRENINIFVQRSRIIKYIRKFFDEMNFVEVETPTLNLIAGGAAARPFVTYHNDLGQRMYLRIAPELYLKELIVGGMDRVYELGKQFRNEGIDLTHNPEFTSIEAYWAYHDYNDWMTTTEDLLYGLAMELHGSPIVKYAPLDSEGKRLPEVYFNFNKPFKRLRIIPELEKRMNVSFANVNFEDDSTITLLLEMCKRFNIEPAPPFTVPRLLDELIAHFLEPECHDPCFLCDHPRVMSPLAKWHRDDTRLTERFELFVNKKELVNAYTELNNPIVQREEFEKQMRNRDKGDDESMEIDHDFVRALEYALPPTGGWGLGIDRLVMFLTSHANIKEVLLFPAMKPDVSNVDESKSLTYRAGTKFNGQGVPLLM